MLQLILKNMKISVNFETNVRCKHHSDVRMWIHYQKGLMTKMKIWLSGLSFSDFNNAVCRNPGNSNQETEFSTLSSDRHGISSAFSCQNDGRSRSPQTPKVWYHDHNLLDKQYFFYSLIHIYFKMVIESTKTGRNLSD